VKCWLGNRIRAIGASVFQPVTMSKVQADKFNANNAPAVLPSLELDHKSNQFLARTGAAQPPGTFS
jgi:hypothetical protein